MKKQKVHLPYRNYTRCGHLTLDNALRRALLVDNIKFATCRQCIKSWESEYGKDYKTYLN